MKNNVLDVQVSLFANVQSNKPVGELSLYEFLCGNDCRQKWQPDVDKFRIAEKGREELKKLIPAVTVSGTFDVRNSTGLKLIAV